MIKFDTNQCNLLREFLKLKEKCFFWEKNFLGEGFYTTNQNKYNFIFYHSFYSSFCDVIDLQIFFLVNEELSNITGRCGFDELWNQVFEGDVEKEKYHLSGSHYVDMKDLFIWRYNPILGSLMLDFLVSAFSDFENWISKLFDEICDEQRKIMNNSRKEKIKKCIEVAYKNKKSDFIQLSDDEMEDLISKINSIPKYDYFSFPDKLECIYKVIDKESYKRNWKEDKSLVSFLAARRNTVHNQGIHTSKNKELRFKDRVYILEQGKPYKVDKYTDDLSLIGELIDIYTELLKSIHKDIRLNKIASFVEFSIDELSIKILAEICSDIINISDGNTENIDIVKCNLAKNFSLSEIQIERLISFIEKSEKKEFHFEDMIELFSFYNPPYQISEQQI